MVCDPSKRGDVMPWNYRRYGSATDPIHKSHLNDITGDHGCPTRFRYEMDARADGGGYDANRPVSGLAACGTAAHETIARVLVSDVRARVLAGPGAVTRAQLERAFGEEFAREVSGRTVDWRGRDAATTHADCVTMVAGLLDTLHCYVAEVLLVEPAFITRCGAHWLSGHIDLVYRPRHDPSSIAIADWKTGARRPHPIVIDHAWEAGVYSLACRDGWFLRRESLTAARSLEPPWTWTVTSGTHTHAATHPSRYIAERTCAEHVLSDIAAGAVCDLPGTVEGHIQRFNEFPSAIYHVHLQDYVPYQRAGRKQVTRAEDLAFYHRDQPGSVAYKPGDARGPAWIPVRLSEHDVPRVIHRIRNVVGMIRMGRFIDQIGERCARCPFSGDCLTGGYAMPDRDRRQLELAINAADVTAADDLVID